MVRCWGEGWPLPSRYVVSPNLAGEQNFLENFLNIQVGFLHYAACDKYQVSGHKNELLRSLGKNKDTVALVAL